MTDSSAEQEDAECRFVELGAYSVVSTEIIEYCPSCSAPVEADDAPGKFKCTNSGETFWIEL